MDMKAKYDGTLTDAITELLAGESAITFHVGLDTDSLVRMGVVAIVTTLICVFLIKLVK